MIKKLTIALGTIAVIAVGATMFAGFESHLIDVRAHVEKATYVTPDDLNFGITIMEQEYDKSCNPTTNPTGTNPPACMAIHLSSSFLAQTQFSDVRYTIYCEDKPVGDAHRGDGNITPFILVSDSDPSDGNDTVLRTTGCGSVAYGASAPPATSNTWATGVLDKGFDPDDLWDMKFSAPLCSDNYNAATDPITPAQLALRPGGGLIDSAYCHKGPGPDSDEYTDLASFVKFQVMSLSVP